jgi:hypothetical protein
MQGGHYPESQAGYGYGNQPMLVPQQWGQQHGEPQPYEIAYQQGYNDTDPSPFAQHGGQVQHHQGYADGDMEFGDGGYYEDEEPRRGKRWLLIAVALVGAIGVGGALAYTYRSIVAPKSRIAAVKTEPGVKVKVPERPPIKAAEEAPPPKVVEPPPQEDPPSGGGDGGIRTVRPIIIGPDSGKASGGPVRVPGITLYTPPEATAPPAPSAKEAAIKEVQPSPGKRVKLGSPPPLPVEKEPAENEAAAKEADEETPEPPPSPIRKTPSQTALAVPKPPPAPKESAGSGLGFVAVLKSEKSSMDAMKTYADLQQRYPEVLAGKSFDVQEADLSARGLGVMFRVVVGPPGSHNAASGVCARLKAAGYVGCWVKEY